jgi:hypothetical protein
VHAAWPQGRGGVTRIVCPNCGHVGAITASLPRIPVCCGHGALIKRGIPARSPILTREERARSAPPGTPPRWPTATRRRAADPRRPRNHGRKNLVAPDRCRGLGPAPSSRRSSSKTLLRDKGTKLMPMQRVRQNRPVGNSAARFAFREAPHFRKSVELMNASRSASRAAARSAPCHCGRQ